MDVGCAVRAATLKVEFRSVLYYIKNRIWFSEYALKTAPGHQSTSLRSLQFVEVWPLHILWRNDVHGLRHTGTSGRCAKPAVI